MGWNNGKSLVAPLQVVVYLNPKKGYSKKCVILQVRRISEGEYASNILLEQFQDFENDKYRRSELSSARSGS